jgi:hypothetical protein
VISNECLEVVELLARRASEGFLDRGNHARIKALLEFVKPVENGRKVAGSHGLVEVIQNRAR